LICFRPVAATTFVVACGISGICAQDLPRGTIIDDVKCVDDPAQSYALYLPSSYTPERKFPILYAFDPLARGVRPVELFKDAAETYGYIVVGSNNSRNGVAVTEFVRTLWADTHARFAVDERRTYTAGFSGGARVAVGVAYMYEGAVAGVIACGGGFPANVKPAPATPFVLFGAAGTDDFNYPELRQLNRALDAHGVPNRFAVFAGAQDWPPRAVCTQAIEWLELQAMRAGRRARDEAMIETLLRPRADAARAAAAAQKSYDAYVAYEALAREFAGLRDVAEYERAARQLAAGKEVKDALKREREEDEKQFALAAELQRLAQPAAPSPDSNEAVALSAFRDAAARLRKQAQAEADTSARRVARRALGQLIVGHYERAAALRRQKQYAAAAGVLERLTTLSPDSPRAFYDLAAAYALDGQRQKALKALKRAVAVGLTDAALVEQSADLAALRSEAEFKQLVEGLRKTAKPPPQ
jgi:tetratricopeptide (TPR) repeat protein